MLLPVMPKRFEFVEIGSGRKQMYTQTGMEATALYFSRPLRDVCLISKEILGHLYSRDAQLDKCLQVRE
jgi:hypothetical protein